jgi:hypothetical protein
VRPTEYNNIKGDSEKEEQQKQKQHIKIMLDTNGRGSAKRQVIYL